MTSYRGFKWPKRGRVEAPDWNPEPVCVGGLHGLRPGDNEPGQWYDYDKYLALRVVTADIVDLNGKCKFPAATVLHVADNMANLSAWLQARGETGPWYRGTATAGYGGTAAAGYRGTASVGSYGTATAGSYGTASAGYRGTASVGSYGTALAGESGTASAGRYGTATAGYLGTASAGYGGIIQIRWSDGTRYRIATAYVGENGIKANVLYRLDNRGQFVED